MHSLVRWIRVEEDAVTSGHKHASFDSQGEKKGTRTALLDPLLHCYIAAPASLYLLLLFCPENGDFPTSSASPTLEEQWSLWPNNGIHALLCSQNPEDQLELQAP
jgi:hypothetical protein